MISSLSTRASRIASNAPSDSGLRRSTPPISAPRCTPTRVTVMPPRSTVMGLPGWDRTGLFMGGLLVYLFAESLHPSASVCPTASSRTSSDCRAVLSSSGLDLEFKYTGSRNLFGPLLWLDIVLTRDRRPFDALGIHERCKLRRRCAACDESDACQARLNLRFIEHEAHLRCDPFAQVGRHAFRTEQPEKASERKIRISRFDDRRYVLYRRAARRIGNCEQLDLSRLDGTEHRSQWHHRNMDATFGQIGNRTDGTVVGDEGGGESGPFLEGEVSEIRRTRNGIKVELGRVFPRPLDELRERADFQLGAGYDTQEVFDRERDWLHIRWVVRDLRAQEWNNGERAVRGEEERMAVAHVEERLRSDHGVRPGPILDDDRLLPLFGQRVGQRARRHVHRDAGIERRDDATGSLRATFRPRRLGGHAEGGEQNTCRE